MTMAQIMKELPKLTAKERREIRQKLIEMDVAAAEWLDEGELTDEEKRIIVERLDACEKDPKGFIPWEQVKAELQKRFCR